MRVTPTAIPDVKLIVPKKFEDARGFFIETYSQRALAAAGIDLTFVQDNRSLSRQAGTVRGLHFQIAPFAQDKLIRVVRGSILDIALDIRVGSPSYGQHVAVTLSGDDPAQLLVPVGFAHGFCTLEPDTEIEYKVSAPYAPDCDRGIYWNDPALGIAWPVEPDAAILSDKDRKHPVFAETPAFFHYAAR